MKENNIIRHYETPTKHTDKQKYNSMNMEQSLQKVQELIRSPKSQQAMFTKTKAQKETVVKASCIVAEQVTIKPDLLPRERL